MALESPGKWVWSWKVLEILLQGPGKSWNFIDYDVGGGHNDAGANLWLSFDTQNRKGIQLHGDLAPWSPTVQFMDNLFAICQ